MQFRGRKSEPAGGAAGTLVERPFLEEMRAVEKLLPIAPDEINRRVLGSRLDDADRRPGAPRGLTLPNDARGPAKAPPIRR